MEYNPVLIINPELSFHRRVYRPVSCQFIFVFLNDFFRTERNRLTIYRKILHRGIKCIRAPCIDGNLQVITCE